MEKRRWQDILKELHSEAMRDAYYCRADSLRYIVDELMNELEYVGLIEKG